MKDSGVQWIGLIPDDWTVERFKTAIEEIQTGAWGEEPNVLDSNAICLRIADFDYLNLRFKDSLEYTVRSYKKDTIKKIQLKKGDLLMEKSGGGDKWPVGRVVIFDKDIEALFANFMSRIRCREHVLPDFMKYIFNAFYMNGSSRIYVNQTTGIQNYDLPNMLQSEFFCRPDIAIQKKIVAFLNDKSVKIDHLIQNTKQTIEEYKKLKQAVITKAVTKGIRENRKLKDSGIEWIGQIPEEWDNINPKALFGLRKQKAIYGERQLTASQQYGIVYQDDYMKMTGSKVVTVMKDFDILKHVESGDFVISMRSFQGGIEYSEKTGSISSAYVMLIPNLKYVFPRYYRWLLKCQGYITALNGTTDLVRDGQAMRYSNFAQVRLIKVPIDEQKEIADYLDKKCANIDTLISQKEQFITELEKYKQSLIYEYVTGKKEVK